jgi:hypothetical protein
VLVFGRRQEGSAGSTDRRPKSARALGEAGRSEQSV